MTQETEPTDVFAACQQRMAPPGTPCLPMHHLLTPGALELSMAPLARRYPGGDRRAIGSIWAKLHARAVVAPLAAALVQARTEGGAAPAPLGLLEREGDLAGLVLAPATLPDAEALAAAVLHGHMVPLYAALGRQTRLSPRVAWANAGNLLDWGLAEMARTPRWAAAAAHWRDILIHSPRNALFPDRNPLHAPVRTVHVPVAGGTVPHRLRRVCCIRDLIPALPLCTTCPRLSVAALAALAARKA